MPWYWLPYDLRSNSYTHRIGRPLTSRNNFTVAFNWYSLFLSALVCSLTLQLIISKSCSTWIMIPSCFSSIVTALLRLAQSVRLALSFTAIVQLLHLVSSLAYARAFTHIDTVHSDVSVHPCAISDHKANRRNAPVSLLVWSLMQLFIRSRLDSIQLFRHAFLLMQLDGMSLTFLAVFTRFPV